MNPPTDVGKKDLPPALRSRFTEIYVAEQLPTAPPLQDSLPPFPLDRKPP